MRNAVTKLRSTLSRWFTPGPAQWSRAAGYGFALALSLLTFGIRDALQPFLQNYSVYLLFTLPVAVSAMCAGFGPALLASGLGVLLSDYFFLPRGIFAVYPDHLPVALFETALFLAASALVAKLGGDLRARRLHAESVAEQLRHSLAERDALLEKVSVLSGLLPICAACKSIKDENGNWMQMELYISQHSDAKFTHGMCPVCMEEWYGEEFRGRSA